MKLFEAIGVCLEELSGTVIAGSKALRTSFEAVESAANLVKENVDHLAYITRLENKAEAERLAQVINSKNKMAIAKMLFKQYKTKKDLEDQLIAIGASDTDKKKILDSFEDLDE